MRGVMKEEEEGNKLVEEHGENRKFRVGEGTEVSDNVEQK